mmetsp:Transcript_8640/g.17689  ORF Transcript_8640/g.17689 Transcript_8640/m.17689 type:complete len:241 (-) Transcript_8640:386-1108(-)
MWEKIVLDEIRLGTGIERQNPCPDADKDVLVVVAFQETEHVRKYANRQSHVDGPGPQVEEAPEEYESADAVCLGEKDLQYHRELFGRALGFEQVTRGRGEGGRLKAAMSKLEPDFEGRQLLSKERYRHACSYRPNRSRLGHPVRRHCRIHYGHPAPSFRSPVSSASHHSSSCLWPISCPKSNTRDLNSSWPQGRQGSPCRPRPTAGQKCRETRLNGPVPRLPKWVGGRGWQDGVGDGGAP